MPTLSPIELYDVALACLHYLADAPYGPAELDAEPELAKRESSRQGDPGHNRRIVEEFLSAVHAFFLTLAPWWSGEAVVADGECDAREA